VEAEGLSPRRAKERSRGPKAPRAARQAQAREHLLWSTEMEPSPGLGDPKRRSDPPEPRRDTLRRHSWVGGAKTVEKQHAFTDPPLGQPDGLSAAPRRPSPGPRPAKQTIRNAGFPSSAARVDRHGFARVVTQYAQPTTRPARIELTWDVAGPSRIHSPESTNRSTGHWAERRTSPPPPRAPAKWTSLQASIRRGRSVTDWRPGPASRAVTCAVDHRGFLLATKRAVVDKFFRALRSRRARQVRRPEWIRIGHVSPSPPGSVGHSR